jgi:hypothetical protein
VTGFAQEIFRLTSVEHKGQQLASESADLHFHIAKDLEDGPLNQCYQKAAMFVALASLPPGQEADPEGPW